jgi:hypothetical protein
MAVGAESAVQAVELESFATSIPSLIPMSATLFSLAKDRFTSVPVSHTTLAGTSVSGTTRPSFRVPFRVQGGSGIAQGTGNGDSLGSGNASQWADFVLSPVYHYATNQQTRIAQAATGNKKRGLISLKAEELKNSLDSAMTGLEAIMYGDSSGALTQIPTGATVSSGSGSGNATSYITGIRAMALTDNQVVQIFPSEGGSSRGNATVSVTDPASSTVFFSTALPSSGGATAVGDYIMVAGSTGALNQGVFGTTAWNSSATTGTIAGVNRADYPNRVTAPSINLNNGSITASLAQRVEALLGRAMGGDNKSKDSGIYILPEDQAVAIATTNYYNKQITQNSDEGGGGNKKVPDTSRKYFQGTYGGRESHLSYTQPSGRLDLLLTDEWYLGELIPLQLYQYGDGVTSIPVPGTSNDWLTAFQFAYEAAFNLACSAPKHQLFVYGASQPTI